jgi:hypothetical protein
MAPATSTTDSAACITSSAFCGSAEWSRVLRLAPRSASTGLRRVASHAGARPNRSPVSSDSPKANPRTGIEGVVLKGR